MQKRISIGAAALLAAIAFGSVSGFADDGPVATAPIQPPLPKAAISTPMVAPSSPVTASRPSSAAPAATASNSAQIAKAPAKSKQKAVAAKKAEAKKVAKLHHNPAGQVAKEVAQEAKVNERRNRVAVAQPPHPPYQTFAGGPPPAYPAPDYYRGGPSGAYGAPWYGRGGGYAYAPPYPGMRPPPW